MEPVQPGDILAVRTSPSIWGCLIRLGAALRGRPPLDDHIVIVTDVSGDVVQGIEGRPSGVGRVDCGKYDGPYVYTNAQQVKTPNQRIEIARLATAMIGTPYDWIAIADDTLQALHLERKRVDDDYGTAAPGHVVCSSLAAWIYHQVGLEHPQGPARWCTPGDWTDWMLANGWR